MLAEGLFHLHLHRDVPNISLVRNVYAGLMQSPLCKLSMQCQKV